MRCGCVCSRWTCALAPIGCWRRWSTRWACPSTPWLPVRQRACPAAAHTATAHRCGSWPAPSPQHRRAEFTQPGRAVGRSRHRPLNLNTHFASAEPHLDRLGHRFLAGRCAAPALHTRARTRAQPCQLNRYEQQCPRALRRRLACPATRCWAQPCAALEPLAIEPPANHACVHTVGLRNGRHRRPRGFALLQYRRLELRAVYPSRPTFSLGLHRCPPNSRGRHVLVALAYRTDGMAGRSRSWAANSQVNAPPW
jgi:hypothetical protein